VNLGFIGTEVGSKYPKDPKKLLEALKHNNISIASQWFSSMFTSINQPDDFMIQLRNLKFI
jgi:sugar phosphate isomerase/epimerase